MSAPERPAPTAGLRHVALFVQPFEACLDFYTRLMGMEVEWQPDADNAFLCSGNDNLALHRTDAAPAAEGQRLDHIGFIIDEMDDVDRWHAFLVAEGVPAFEDGKTHQIDWRRHADGTMTVAIDGQRVLTTRDQGFRSAFNGLTVATTAGDYSVRRVVVDGM